MHIITIIAGAALGIPLYVYILGDDRRWLVVAIMSHLLLFMRTNISKGEMSNVGMAEIAFSALFFPGLILWFIKRFRGNEVFVEGWEDLVTILFVIYAFLGIGIAVSQGFSFEKGLREFLLFVPLLFIFPVRKEARKEGGKNWIIWTFLTMSIVVALFSVVKYRLDLSAAKYLWQIAADRQQREESLYMVSIMVLSAFLVGRHRWKPMILVLLAIDLFALAITFSRGYWITTAVGLFALVFLLRGQARRRMITLSALAMLLAFVVGVVILPRIFGALFTGIGERFSSVSINTLSLQDRLAESEAVLHKITMSPIVGYGLGALFSFFDIIRHGTIETWYIHNGYLFILFKFGIVGFCLFFAMYLKRVLTLMNLWRRTKETADNPLVSSFLLIPVMMLFLSVTSPQFDDRGSLLILSIIWGIGETTWKTRPD